jgi:uncharacterized membrane protein
MLAVVLQLVQAVGALLILIAFAAVQRKRMSTEARSYLWLNLTGSLVLFVVAIVAVQIGFIVLELAWSAVSAFGLWRSYHQTRPAGH